MAGKKAKERNEKLKSETVDNFNQAEVDADIAETIELGDNIEQEQMRPIQEYQPTGQSQDENAPKRHVDIIGEEEIGDAVERLKKYMKGKKNLDERVRRNEEWWKLRHWNQFAAGTRQIVKPTSAWLFNSIMNKLADCSDNFPETNVRARMQDDVDEAQRLKHLLPMIFEYNDYESTYMSTCLSKIKNGTGITGVFWNSTKDDIDIEPIDILTIYWEPGITDIQASRDVFTLELVDNDLLRTLYPNLEIPTGQSVSKVEYIYEDSIDVSEKSIVIDWYYKKEGKLQYCKFVNGVILTSSENEPDDFPNGFYEDGQYPFVVDTLFKMEGTIAGFGYLDVCKSPQEYIDRVDRAILTNTMMSAYPRYFIRNDSKVNKDDMTDWENPFVPTGTSLGQDDIKPIEVNPISGYVIQAKEEKIQELKQTSGNSDVATGTTASGVTAASAISQLIETGSKGSRFLLKGTYRSHKLISYMIIERIRQFYNEPRYIRMLGPDGTETFDIYKNTGLVEQTYSGFSGESVNRVPMFDLECTAQKASAYNKMSQNELALQFYQYGFFAPQNADASLACLNMMDFDHKEEIMQDIQRNQTLLMMVEQLQQQVKQLSIMANLFVPGANLNVDGQSPAAANANIGVGEMPDEQERQRAWGKTTNSITNQTNDDTQSQAAKARQRVADSTEV